MSTPEGAAGPARVTMSELVEDSRSLISLPEVYVRLRQVMDAPDSSMEDVAKVIALDPALTARLLRIANSALYNFPAQIETLSRAVNILGLRQVHDLVLATSVAKAFNGLPNELMDMKTFWYRSIYRGFLAREFATAVANSLAMKPRYMLRYQKVFMSITSFGRPVNALATLVASTRS